jgi:hypothetical protein
MSPVILKHFTPVNAQIGRKLTDRQRITDITGQSWQSLEQDHALNHIALHQTRQITAMTHHNQYVIRLQ